MHKIISVKAFDDFILWIKFSNNIEKKIDIKPFIGSGVSSELKNLEYFKNVKLTDGYIHWDNGYDFCSNFLYEYKPL